MLLFRPLSHSDRTAVVEKKKKKRYVGRAYCILIFWLFLCFTKIALSGMAISKVAPSPWPQPCTFWKAETISYIHVAFVSLTLPHGAYLGRICTNSPRAAKRVLSTFFETTNVAAISTIGLTHCSCGDQGLLQDTLFKWACVFS